MRGPLSGREKLALAALCLLALALRLRVGINATYIIHPDETYDFLEQGHRLAFGYGVLTWTYAEAVRSYLLPGLIAGVMRLAAWFDPRPDAYLNAVAVVFAILSLSVVITGFVWGRRLGGTLGGVITGFVNAVWFELIYFAPHALSEVAATAVLVIAACLCPMEKGGGHSPWRWWWLGLCLGLTFTLRIQLAPAIAVIGVWLLLLQGWRVALGIAAVAALPVLAAGLLDAVTYDYPFETFYRYLIANTFGGVASFYGRSPVDYLFDLEIHYLGGAAALVALGCVVGGLSFPLGLCIAVVIFATHTLFAHKEYRFIYPALPFVLTLAGIATTRLVEALGRGLPRWRPAALAGVAMGLWAFTSWAQAIEGPFRREWLRGSGEIAAARFIAGMTDVCGVAAYGLAAAGAGLVRLHHDVGFYWAADAPQFARYEPGFNVLIAADDSPPPDGAFSGLGCWDNGWNEASLNRRMPRVCVWRRAGSCGAVPSNEPDPVLGQLPWRKGG